jgi:hypothetical protein
MYGWLELKETTIALAVDCTKAYNRVWKPRLYERLMEEGMCKKMILWVKSLLEDRRACVRVGQDMSDYHKIRDGLPQVAVCSPVLFLLYANDWKDTVQEVVDYSGFADDICIWAKNKYWKIALEDVQNAAGKITAWADSNKIELNPTKSEACVFSTKY